MLLYSLVFAIWASYRLVSGNDILEESQSREIESESDSGPASRRALELEPELRAAAGAEYEDQFLALGSSSEDKRSEFGSSKKSAESESDAEKSSHDQGARALSHEGHRSRRQSPGSDSSSSIEDGFNDGRDYRADQLGLKIAPFRRKPPLHRWMDPVAGSRWPTGTEKFGARRRRHNPAVDNWLESEGDDDDTAPGAAVTDDDDSDWRPHFEEAEEGETSDRSVLAGMIAEFMADSQVQLVMDLDLLKSLFADPGERIESTVKQGDDSYVRQLLGLLEPLKEYDVSAPCLADLSHFLWSAIEYARSIRESYCTNCSCDGRVHDTKQHQWIFNVVDAMGKVPAGILGGNNLWIGSWSACRRVSVIKNRQGQKWSGQYCMARFQPFNRDNPLKSIGSSQSHDPSANCRAPSSNNRNASDTAGADDDYEDECFDLIPLLNYGICTPDTCTAYDTKKIIDLIYKSTEALMSRQVVCNVDIVCRNNLPESQMSHDTTTMTVLFFLVFIATLMIFGTLYDYVVYQRELVGDPKKFYEQQNWFVKVLLAFSVYTNGKFVLRTEKGERQIHCLHGTRVLSMFWIILGHTYYYVIASLTVDNLLPTLVAFPQRFFNLIIVQAPLAVDSFFYLSGMLTCYLFMEKFKVEAAKGRSIFSIDMWSLFYIHRYIRLTPIYVVIMVLDVTLFTYVSDGPFWRPIESNYCRQTWWTNLIYMNNFLLQDTETCMGWTWYLANDMQFHFFAPIFLILLFKSSIIGIIACIAVIIASSIVHLMIVLAHDYPPAPMLTADLQIVRDLETYWPDVYVKPYIRCTPYVLGMLTGFALHKLGMKPVFPKWKVALGWIISLAFGIGSVFGLYNYAKTGEISEWMRVCYVLFGRNGYALSLAWVTFACAIGYGGPVNSLLSWRAWIPLSRITFCAYLIHPILLQIYNLSRPHPFHYTTVYQMFYLFAVAVVKAYFMGFFLSLAFEVPVSTLETLAVNKIMAKIRSIMVAKKPHRPKDAHETETEPLKQTDPLKRVEVTLTLDGGGGGGDGAEGDLCKQKLASNSSS